MGQKRPQISQRNTGIRCLQRLIQYWDTAPAEADIILVDTYEPAEADTILVGHVRACRG